MEKLIELLNEYRPNSWMEYMGGIAYIGADQYSYPVDCEVLTIISKEYGFIKRLVDNDKIDIVKWIKYGLKDGRDIENYKYDKNKSRKNRARYWTEYLLMTLSIQDEPIAFLCSILK